MSKSNEKSSKKLGTLASQVLQQKSSSKTAKSLAGSVLTQRPNHGGNKGGKKR